MDSEIREDKERVFKSSTEKIKKFVADNDINFLEMQAFMELHYDDVEVVSAKAAQEWRQLIEDEDLAYKLENDLS